MMCKTGGFAWIPWIPEDFSVQSDFQTSSQCVTVPPCLEIATRCSLYPCSGSLWSQGSLSGLGVILLLHVETWSWDCRWTWKLSCLPIRDSRARSTWGLPWCNIACIEPIIQQTTRFTDVVLFHIICQWTCHCKTLHRFQSTDRIPWNLRDSECVDSWDNDSVETTSTILFESIRQRVFCFVTLHAYGVRETNPLWQGLASWLDWINLGTREYVYMYI